MRMRWLVVAVMAFALAGCHTTSLGRSVGFPAPERTGQDDSRQR